MDTKNDLMPRMRHEAALDGVRGLAILAVFLFNIGWDVFKGGYYGVDIFFVLSGFLITTLLCEEWLRRGDLSVGNFLYRRALRLLPALLFLVVVTSLFSVLAHNGDKVRRQLLEGVATLLYVVNWTTLLKVAKGGGLAHCWSLAAEGQFYIAWFILIRVILRGQDVLSGLRRVFIVSVGIAALCYLWRCYRWQHGTPWYWLYLGTDCRLDSIFTGCSLGAMRLFVLVSSKSHGIRRIPTNVWSVCCLFSFVVAAVLVSASNVESRWTYFVGFPLISVCTGLWIWVGSMAPAALGAQVLRNSFLGWLGRISYSLYLWHYCVFSVLNVERLEGWGIKGIAAAFLRIVVSLASACFSYYVIERWAMGRRERVRERLAA